MHKGGDEVAFIEINGKEFPAPDNSWELIVATNVSDGKNAQGEFIGDKVGRDQYKINNLQWTNLPAATWAEMCQEFSAFVVTAKIWDMVHNDWITLQMYPGNRSATAGQNDAGQQPTVYKKCKVNIVDCGVIE